MKLKKLLTIIGTMLLILPLSSCEIWGENGQSSSGGEGCSGLPGKEEWTLDDVAEYLNGSDFDMGVNGNTVAVIPFRHINGPRDEWSFFALVNFEYKMSKYWKYQVTFLSCTCRNPNVNYWSTMYVELTTKSDSADDFVIQRISFEYDKDNEDTKYQVGFWGDSNPIHGSNNSLTGAEVTYTDIRDGYIKYLEGLKYGEIKNWDVVEDIIATTDEKYAEMRKNLDSWTGASVSTNNILRCLQAICEYHVKKERW